MVESAAKLDSKRWHRQRAHVVIAAMRRFAAELRAEGFEVDHRRSASLATGFADHVAEHAPERVRAMAPASWSGRELLERLGVEVVASDQFLCHPDEFADYQNQGERMGFHYVAAGPLVRSSFHAGEAYIRATRSQP